MFFFILLFLILSSLFTMPFALARIYQWVDEKGVENSSMTPLQGPGRQDSEKEQGQAEEKE